MTDSEWITPGAEVVAYTSGAGTPTFHKTTIAKVATKSFTVVGLSVRFKLGSLRSADQGDAWHPWHWQVVKPGDPIVASLVQQRRLSRLAADAYRAVREWNTGDSRQDVAKIDAVIESMRAFKAALGVREDGD